MTSFLSFLYYMSTLFTMINGIYIPTGSDSPMLDGKGDIRLDVAPLLYGVGSTVSYGVTDNLFVQGQVEAFYDNDGINTHYYGQVASGWYNNHNNRVVELFGGVYYGYGNIDLNRGYKQYGNYTTCFLQGNYGWKGLANSHIDIALGAKLGYYHVPFSIYYHHLHAAVTHTDQALFMESAVNFRFGWEKLKFNLKIGQVFHKEYNLISNYPHAELSLNYHFKSGNRE